MSLRSKSVKRSNAKSINFEPRYSSLVFSQLTSNQLSLFDQLLQLYNGKSWKHCSWCGNQWVPQHLNADFQRGSVSFGGITVWAIHVIFEFPDALWRFAALSPGQQGDYRSQYLYIPKWRTYRICEFTSIHGKLATGKPVHGVVLHQQIPVEDIIVISSDESAVSVDTTASM